MSQIYRRAQSVLVWLGEDHQNSSVTLNTIRSISTYTDAVTRAPYLTDRVMIWKGLIDLSRRRYWTRIWIVQEITVGRGIELLCGGEIVPWSAFASACKFPPDLFTSWASDLWAPPGNGDYETQRMRTAAGRELYRSTMYGLIRSQSRWPIYVDPFEALYERYKGSGCQDNRDRIFALLGIASEVALQRGFNVDYEKNMEDTFISLVAWEGTGTIEIHSRIRFARLAAKAMNLEWSDYLLESKIESESQRSPNFFKWVDQILKIPIRCVQLGNWSFDRYYKTAKAKIPSGVFLFEPIEIYLPLDAVEHFTDLDFDLFGFKTSNVLLACKATQYDSWTVIARAFYRMPHEEQQDYQAANQSCVRSVFEGLNIIADGASRCSIELNNVAQFMEILLAKLGPGIWGRRPGGGGNHNQNQRPNMPSSGPRESKSMSFVEVLEQLRNTNSVASMQRGKKGNPEEIIDDDSVVADMDKLLAESETLAKPRVPRASVEKPSSRRGSTSHGSWEMQGSLSATLTASLCLR